MATWRIYYVRNCTSYSCLSKFNRHNRRQVLDGTEFKKLQKLLVCPIAHLILHLQRVKCRKLLIFAEVLTTCRARVLAYPTMLRSTADYPAQSCMVGVAKFELLLALKPKQCHLYFHLGRMLSHRAPIERKGGK